MTLPPPEPADGGDEPRWDPGDETAIPEPEIDPNIPPLEFDDDDGFHETQSDGAAADVEAVYAERQQVLSPGLNGTPFATEESPQGGAAGGVG